MYKVMLDAGHYGDYNRSPAVREYWESHMTWKLHLLLKAELEAYGVSVGTTRNAQKTDLEVYERGRKAKGYDMFVSLHSNAVGAYVNEDIVYPIVYRLIDDDSGLAHKLSSAVESVMNTGANARVGTRLLTDGKEYYGVLRGAKAVGCTRAYIIEHSFHTATKPARWLLDESNLARLAKAEAKVIAGYFGIKETVNDKEDNMTEELKAKIEKLENKISAIEKANAELNSKTEAIEKANAELYSRTGSVEKKIVGLEKDKEKVYHYWSEIETELPWAYKPLWALHEAGIFSGESPSDLNASYTLIRALVCLYAAMEKCDKER